MCVLFNHNRYCLFIVAVCTCLLRLCSNVYTLTVSHIQATNLRFMEGYGNPRLSMDEAGYYLTTLEAAAAFIEHLKSEDLREPNMYAR